MFKTIFEIEYEDFGNYDESAKKVDFAKVFAIYNAFMDAGLADTKEAHYLANILQI